MKHILIASLLIFSWLHPVLADSAATASNPFSEITDPNELLKRLETETDAVVKNFKGKKAKEKNALKKQAKEIITQAKSDIPSDGKSAENNDDKTTPETQTKSSSESAKKEIPTDEEIKELRAKADAAHERETSTANKMLGAAGIGATGVGGMMLMQGMAEKSADGDAEQQMRAYLATFNCQYGDGRAQGGETDVELPGANALIPLYSEYVTLANSVKSMKSELGLKPGIESESILDSATSGLYDDVSIGKTSGAFTSLARALMDPDGADAKAWAQETEKTSQNIKTGAITAGAGAGVGLVGHITESAVYKKKSEKNK